MTLTAEHNTNGNNKTFQENKPHFHNQTGKVLYELSLGVKVTGQNMYVKYSIQDIRPRIAAIKKALKLYGIELQESKILKGHGAKQWHIAETDLPLLTNLLKKIAA
jgi:hypothetical protein